MSRLNIPTGCSESLSTKAKEIEPKKTGLSLKTFVEDAYDQIAKMREKGFTWPEIADVVQSSIPKKAPGLEDPIIVKWRTISAYFNGCKNSSNGQGTDRPGEKSERPSKGLKILPMKAKGDERSNVCKRHDSSSEKIEIAY